MNDKTKNMLIIILIVLLIISGVITGYLLLNKDSSIKTITGTVIITGEDFCMIETDEGDYLINGFQNKYRVGDEVKFTYNVKDLNENTSPKSIKIESEKLIKQSTSDSIDEDYVERAEEKDDGGEFATPATPSTPATNPNDTPATTKPTTKPTSDADTQVLEYIDNLKKDFDAGAVKDSLKSGFVAVVDFLFYNGEIKGHTFSELTDAAQLKVLSAALYFDSKIDTYFPGYKESISSTAGKVYSENKNAYIQSYLMITMQVCENDPELCESAKKGFGELKKNFGLTWELLKDIAGDGIGKLKYWYEIFRAS